MKISNLNEFVKGWFIGNFEPSLFKTNDFEISIKRYKKGDYEKSHVHKIATEYTIIVEGEVIMDYRVYKKDDIITIEPGEYTDFQVISDDCITCVVKTPCAKNDKYEK